MANNSAAGTTRLYAIQDASIKENTDTNGNWSKNEVYGSDTPIIALVEFDLSSFSQGDGVKSATFSPYVRTLKDNSSSDFSIYSTSPKAWSQDSVKWSSRPLKEELLDTIQITQTGSYVDFDVTTAVQEAINNGQSKVTFWIEDSKSEYQGFEFDSVNNNPDYPNEPQLNVATSNSVQTITEPSSSQSFTDVNGLQIVGSTVNDKDWNQHVGGRHLRADLSQLNDQDTSTAVTFQWYADDLAISGATASDLVLEDYNISSEAIYLVATYSTLSGEQVTVTSPTLEQGDWRIFSGGEDGTISGSNPAPFMETYSFSNSSSTHNGDGWYEGRIPASDTHSITSVGAAEVGLSAIEGDSIIRIAATEESKRAELGNRNWNTRVQENQDLYISEKIYLPKEEWDVVTQYSTIIFQHKQYPGADPNFELRLSNEGDYKLFVQSHYGHYGLTGAKHNDHTIATLSPDRWHDLKIHLTPSQDDSLGQLTIYLDGETVFSETGTNLNDRDNTNDSFLKLGMYTNIEDSRHYYVDAVEMSTFLPSTVSDWVTGDRQVSNTITDTSGSDLLTGTAQADNISAGSTIAQELRILGTAEDRSGVRGVLHADIYGVADLDIEKAVSYQWFADNKVISGATQQTLDVGDHFSDLENSSITVSITYTDNSGSEATATSAAMPYEGFRIVANAEPDRNEWSGVTASEEVANSVNPYPFVESYSNNGTSSTNGTSAGSSHNITSVKASNEGIESREGDYVIRVYADGSRSNRSELAHLNNETSFKEGEEYYFSGSFYAPSTEWDPVTEGGSTVITQLKQYGGGDPNFELRLSNNGDYKMTWRAVPHELKNYQEMGYAIPNSWNDIKIFTKHSQGADGIFQVWLNGEQVIDYSGPTMYRDAEGYLKFGMYTEIHDERVIYWDAIEISDHLAKDFDTWLSSGANLPSINVTGISDGQQYESAADIVIGGVANDLAGEKLGSIGGIQKVELFEDNTSLGSTTNSSFSFNNLSLSDGLHTLRLVATDTDGNTAETTYDIWIGNRPPEALINSANYLLGLVNTNEKMSLTATVSDSDGSVVDVKFLANGNVIGSAVKDVSDQYKYDWIPTTNGAYSIQVQATDNQGAVSLSDSKAVLVGSSITHNTLTAVQDVTIEQNSSLTGNWGETEIYGSTSSPKIALVEFNLNTIGDAKYIQSAVFQPYVTKLQNQPGTFSIYETEAKDWDQASVKWDTRPLKGNLLDTVTIDTKDGYASFDVTKALQNAADAGLSTVTFWIEDSEQEQQRFDFASENNSLNVPAKLVISSATVALPQATAASYTIVSTPDTTAPSFISASTSSDGSKVILNYDETLSTNSAAAASFVVTVGGSTAGISGVSTSGSTVEIALDTAIAHGQSVSVAYADPTSSDDSNATQDAAGNDAISLSGVAVTNNVSAPDTTAPTFKSAATSSDGNKIILDYDEALSSNTAAPSDFIVTVGGSEVAISSVAASGSTVEITLASAIKAGETISMAYTDPTSGNDANTVQDEAGNDVVTLSSTAVTNTVTRNTYVQLLGSNNQSTNNDQFDGVLYAEIGNIDDVDNSRSVEYQWYADGVLMPGYTDVAIRGIRWSKEYQNKSFSVDVTYFPEGSDQTKTLRSEEMEWGNFYFNYGGEPGNGYQGVSNNDGIRDIIIMPDFQGNNPKALSSYLQYDPGVREPGNSSERHSIKTVHQDDVGIVAREGEHLIEFDAKEISNRTELGTGDPHHWFYEGEDIYFGFSIYLPKEEWDPVTQYSTIITQLRQFGMYEGPNFGLRLSNTGDYKLIMESTLFAEGEYPYIATLAPDRWFDIKIHSKQSKGEDGEVNLWIDNQLVWEYDGPTMYYSDDAGYISFGMYTEIRDDRTFYMDAIEQTDHLYRVSSLEEWSQTQPGSNRVSTPDTTTPSFTSATTSSDGNKVILNYDETLSTNSAAAASFVVTVGGSTAGISGVSTSGSTVEIALDTAIAHGQSVSVAYADPTSSDDSNATQDAAGNDAISLSGVAVTNNVSAPDTTAPTFKSAATSSDGNKIILDYDEALSSNTAAPSDFIVTVGGSEVAISSVAASGSTVEITLASAIKAGEAVTVAYIDPTAGDDADAVQDEVGNDVVTLSSTAVTNNSAAGTTRLYAIQDASIKENTDTNGNWSKNEVYGSDTPIIALVEFDLSSFSQGDGVKSATFSPYVRTLKDNSSSDFSIYSTSPKAWSQDSVKWSSRPLKEELLDTIQITQTGSYVDFDVTTAVQEAINNGQSKVTFWIEDSKSEYQGFEFDSVNDNPSYPNEPQLTIVAGDQITFSDNASPTFSSAITSADGNTIILEYNEALSSTTATASDFVVTAGGLGVTISSVAASGSTMELTLASAIKAGEAVSVAYTDPTSGNDANAIQDEAGNDVATLSSTVVTNNSTAGTTRLFAIQDASVLENKGTNGNWSKNEVYGGGTAVVALVEFDLSSFSQGDGVKSATFSPYVRTLKDNSSSDFSIYSTSPKAWSQDSVKWSSRPLKDELLDTIQITQTGSYVDFDVTTAVQEAINNGQSKVTFWIEDSENEYQGFEFDSVNNNPDYPNEPQLNIVLGEFIEDFNITHTSGSDFLVGTSQADNIIAGEGADLVQAEAGNDTITLQSSDTWSSFYRAWNVETNDRQALDGKTKYSTVIDAGDDADTLILSDSTTGDAFFLHDSYSGLHSSLTAVDDGLGSTTVARALNLETIKAGAGDDIVDLTSPKLDMGGIALTLEGEAGDDILWAAEGDDTLNGGAGNDVLFGGEGNDTLIGGTGADVFEFVSSTNAQTDTISDYSSDDKLKFYLASGQSELDQSNISNGNLVWNNLTIDLAGTDVTSLDQLNIVYDYI